LVVSGEQSHLVPVTEGLAGEVVYDDIVLVGDSQYGGCGYDSTLKCTGSGGQYIRVGGADLHKVRMLSFTFPHFTIFPLTLRLERVV
jgi:hypothetical protein